MCKQASMAEHNIVGNQGEKTAIRFLEQKGYRIIDTNWRKGRYELDIVAEYGNELIVVEVKARSVNSLLSPEDAVDKKKIRHIVAAADRYVKSHSLDLPVRFDIISIKGTDIEHLEEAFYPPVFKARRS